MARDMEHARQATAKMAVELKALALAMAGGLERDQAATELAAFGRRAADLSASLSAAGAKEAGSYSDGGVPGVTDVLSAGLLSALRRFDWDRAWSEAIRVDNETGEGSAERKAAEFGKAGMLARPESELNDIVSAQNLRQGSRFPMEVRGIAAAVVANTDDPLLCAAVCVEALNSGSERAFVRVMEGASEKAAEMVMQSRAMLSVAKAESPWAGTSDGKRESVVLSCVSRVGRGFIPSKPLARALTKSLPALEAWVAGRFLEEKVENVDPAKKTVKRKRSL